MIPCAKYRWCFVLPLTVYAVTIFIFRLILKIPFHRCELWKYLSQNIPCIFNENWALIMFPKEYIAESERRCQHVTCHFRLFIVFHLHICMVHCTQCKWKKFWIHQNANEMSFSEPIRSNHNKQCWSATVDDILLKKKRHIKITENDKKEHKQIGFQCKSFYRFMKMIQEKLMNNDFPCRFIKIIRIIKILERLLNTEITTINVMLFVNYKNNFRTCS